MQDGADGGCLQTFRRISACILGQRGVHVEQVGLWESVSAVVADEVRQTSARETTRAPIVGATEGAFPVEIDLIPPYAD